MPTSLRAAPPRGRRYTAQYTTKPPSATRTAALRQPANNLPSEKPAAAKTTFEDIDLGFGFSSQLEKQQPHPPDGNGNRHARALSGARRYFSSTAMWKEEFWWALVCVVTTACLVVLLNAYNGEPVPQLGLGLQIDTAIIALVTVTRVSMSAIVEAAINQGAWIWISEAGQHRSRHRAQLSDFKVFDEASRGMLGSLSLLWRMKLRHLGCIGAFIVIMAHGFETFSQQMVIFEQRPRQLVNGESIPAPEPPRAEVWDSYLLRGFMADLVPTLSTKAAVYNGIISTELPMIAVSCETANCSWPVIPTLAACGECSTVPVSQSCNQTAKTCTYSTPATSLDGPMNTSGYSLFKVTPSNGTVYPIASSSRAYFSVFDMLSVRQQHADEELSVEGNECALWFCIQSYSIFVNGGIQNQTAVSNWSTTTMRTGGGRSYSAEHVFVNIPVDQLNVDNRTRYAVTHEAMAALQGFMTSIITGTVYADVSKIEYSSDWAEAMWNTSDHLQDWVTTFATSMTGEIRRHRTLGGSTGARYDGYGTHLEPFIKVQWRWLLYPCGMIFLSVYYLFHTIIAGARDGISVWKSGALPMLFCRVDERIQDRVGDGMDGPGGLEERVGHLQVAMYRAENGQWTFRTTSAEEN